MKKLFLAIILLLSPIVFFSVARSVSAQTIVNPKKNVILSSDQVVNSDYVAAGNSVDIAGTVNGDVYVAAGTVIVDGTVNGDLLAAGGSVAVKGNVTGSVRILGGNMIVTGNIGKNLSTAGGSLTLISTARIAGNIVSAGGMLTLDGFVNKDVRVAGGQIILGNVVGGNVLAYARQFSISPNANIAGDLTYWTNQKAEIASGAVINGKITQNELPKNAASQTRPIKFASMVPGLAGFVAFLKIISLVASFIVGIIFIKLLPVYSQKVISAVKKGFWKNVGIGLLIAIVTPIAIVLLFITVVGMPFAIFSGMVFAIALYLARVFAALVIGQWAIKYFSKNSHLNWSLLIGLIIYAVLSMIPVLGWIFSAIFTTGGLGAILTEKKQSYIQLRAKKLV